MAMKPAAHHIAYVRSEQGVYGDGWSPCVPSDHAQGLVTTRFPALVTTSGGKNMRQVGQESGIQQATVDAGLLVMRVVAGLVFFMHGYQKLFDNGLSATQAGFDGMGAPLPDITAVLVTFLELAGGLALIAGVLTRIVGLLLAVDMIAAFAIVHQENGFFAANGGFELVFLLTGTAIALALTGPGAYAIDSVFSVGTRTQQRLTTRQAS
jgi:putative oxidoreductase